MERLATAKIGLIIYRSILISAILLLASASAAAGNEEQSREPSSEKEETSEERPGWMERFLYWSDRPHRQVTDRLEALSRDVDSIFGEERIRAEATDTYLQAGGGLVIERGGLLSVEEDFSLSVDLPRTERRIKLVFESENDDDFFNEGNGDSSVSNDFRTSGGKEYSAALQFFVRETKRWNVSLSPGLRFRTPPDPFIRLRLRRTQDLGTTWRARLTERLTEYLDRGLESRTTLEFERRTGEGQLFRLSSRILWREEFENDNTQLSQSAVLFKRLNKRNTIAYSATVVWETKPNLHHELYIADIRWRRRIHKKWLFLEIKPEARFDRDDHFQLDPSLTLSLEILFGRSYLQESQG
ncbi:MAG: hypothetical protein R6V08_11390 [Desulfuromonadales bacterium]